MQGVGDIRHGFRLPPELFFFITVIYLNNLIGVTPYSPKPSEMMINFSESLEGLLVDSKFLPSKPNFPTSTR